MQSLLKNGRVIRGYLGASTQDVTPPLSRLFKLPDVKGVIITDILPKGPAETAGLRRGDVVVRFDSKSVMDSGRLQNVIGSAPIGSKHRLEIIRDGRSEHVDLLIQEAPRDLTRRQVTGPRAVTNGHPLAGLFVDEWTPGLGRQLGVPQSKGVVVIEVVEGSLAEAAGVLPGDLILEVNRQRVVNLPSYQRLVEPIKPKQATLLLINRQGTILYVPIEGE
jgi:serine protease Do